MTDAAAAAVGGQMVKSKMKSAAECCPSCASYPLKRSYFSAKFLATPPSSMQSISVAPSVKLADWPVHEMYDFLGTQRQWGQYLLRDDKLCRQIVAVFVTAYSDVIDPNAEVPVNPMDLLPYAGEHRPLTIMGEVDWIAPHLMNTLVGALVEFGYLPERSAKVLNALIDPMRNRRLALHVGLVLLVNGAMWLVFGIDYIHARIGDGADEQAEAEAEAAEPEPMPEAYPNASGADNSTLPGNSTANATALEEWDYPPEQFPLFMRGVYPRRPAGLKGIPAMPFLHQHVAQLGINSIGFVLFGAILVLKHGITIFVTLSLWLWFFAGFGTWLVGRELNHIGCSGMIFGYFAYIMVIGLLKLFGCPPSCRGVMCTADSTQDIVISAGIIALYTGVLYGVLPSSGVVDMDGLSAEAVVNSWEVDLMGWAGGTLYAAALAIYLRKTRAFKKPGHGNKAPRGKRFASGAAGSTGAEMGSTSTHVFGARPADDSPGGKGEASGAGSAGGDNPFLAHLAQQGQAEPRRMPPVPDPPLEEEQAPSWQPAQPASSASRAETSYV